MPVFRCPVTGCTYATDDITDVAAAALLNLHGYVHSTALQNNADLRQRAPKPARSKISRGSSEETWNTFSSRWTLFKRGTTMDNAEKVRQLFECCNEDLGNVVLKTSPTAVEDT